MADTTFHECGDQLACDACGCLVDRSERGRSAHQRWHTQTTEVIDLTGRVALELDRIAS